KLLDLHPALSAGEKQAVRDALLFKIDHTYALNLSDAEQMLLDPDLPPRESVIDRLVRFGLPTPVVEMAPNGTRKPERGNSDTEVAFADTVGRLIGSSPLPDVGGVSCMYQTEYLRIQFA